MHTTTEIHAATKVAQQMAKKKEKKMRWAQKAGYKHSSKGAKGNTWFRTTHFTTNMTITTNTMFWECFLLMNFSNLWIFDSEVYKYIHNLLISFNKFGNNHE